VRRQAGHGGRVGAALYLDHEPARPALAQIVEEPARHGSLELLFLAVHLPHLRHHLLQLLGDLLDLFGSLLRQLPGRFDHLLAQPETLFWPVVRLVVLAPLAEEVVWRGVIYLGLRQRCSAPVAASLSATAFACWHLAAGWTQLPALILHLVFGLAACWLVERTRSLGAAVLLHSAGNALGLGLYALCMFQTPRLVTLLGA